MCMHIGSIQLKLGLILLKKFKLSKYQSEELIHHMGVDVSRSKINIGGPVGYHPREIIVNSVYEYFLKSSINVKLDTIKKLFKEVDHYQQLKNDYKINLIDGVRKFLESIEGDYKLTVFTSDRYLNTLSSFKYFDIEKYFKEIIGGDNVNNSKPDPEGILKACSKIGIKPSNTAYISDTVSDMRMAEEANVGLKLGVTSGLDKRKALSRSADLVVDSLMEVL